MTANLYTNTLAHLPQTKQKELALIKEYIFERAEPAMIILFGNYTTGKWIDDPQLEDDTVYDYEEASAFDILVVMPDEVSCRESVWDEVSEKIRRDPRIGSTMLISHTLEFLNEKLRAQYAFFVSIYHEGILLHERIGFKVHGPQELMPVKRLEKAADYFAYWLPRGDASLKLVHFCLAEQDYNQAAFHLHQAAERYYSAFQLVFTDHKPNTHDVEVLRNRAGRVNPALHAAFPQRTQEARRVFGLLRSAYTESLHNRTYGITPGELQYLLDNLQLLRRLVDSLCQAELSKLQQAVNSFSTGR